MKARLLILLLLIAGCTPATGGEALGRIELASALRPFDSCEALTQRLRQRGLELVTPYGLPGSMPIAAEGEAVGLEAGGAATARASAAEAPAADSSFSTTNVQEAGIDEPDVVKTDGAHLFTVVDGVLRVVDVRAGRPEVVATLQLDDGFANDLLLHGDRLLVLGQSDVAGPQPLTQGRSATTDMIMPATPQSRLWSVDVSDAARPHVLSTMDVDGATVSARLTGAIARVVMRSTPAPPGVVLPGAGPGAEARALATNRQQIREATASDWLPAASVDGGAPSPLVDCAAVHEPERVAELGMVSVLSLDLQEPRLSPERTQAVLGAADTLYASADSLYVTTTRWPEVIPLDPMPLPVPELPVEPQTPVTSDVPDGGALPTDPGRPAVSEVPSDPGRPIDPPPSPSPDVTPPPTPPDATMPPRPPEPPRVTTEVHRFALVDDGVRYAASGSVPGRALNQWALSEHEGDLRIATTTDQGFGTRRSSSAVRVLRQRGDRLAEIGHVGDLGRGEQIYAVRYAGDVGFVVTFRQVDPLYTLDLSDPSAPRVLGALKIPGYSAYLHPIGDDHLLGVGQDADDQGRTKGVQLSLFDIADLGAPERVAQLGLGPQTGTDVEYDHRAFLYWPDDDLVVLPVQRWDTGRSGAAVFTVDPDSGLSQRGTVVQPSGGQPPAPIMRAVVVEDRLVTVSPGGVMVSDLDTLEPLGNAAF